MPITPLSAVELEHSKSAYYPRYRRIPELVAFEQICHYFLMPGGQEP
jgi:hypothetical protein